jgi:hypothetical protein
MADEGGLLHAGNNSNTYGNNKDEIILNNTIQKVHARRYLCARIIAAPKLIVHGRVSCISARK